MENILFNDVLIMLVILFIRSVNEMNDILWLLDKISGFIKMNVIEFVINIKNVIIKYFVILVGFNIFEVIWFLWDGVLWFIGFCCIFWFFGK